MILLFFFSFKSYPHSHQRQKFVVLFSRASPQNSSPHNCSHVRVVLFGFGIVLHGVVLDQELHSVVEWGVLNGWKTKKDVGRGKGGLTEGLLLAVLHRTALGVVAVSETILKSPLIFD